MERALRVRIVGRVIENEGNAFEMADLAHDPAYLNMVRPVAERRATQASPS